MEMNEMPRKPGAIVYLALAIVGMVIVSLLAIRLVQAIASWSNNNIIKTRKVPMVVLISEEEFKFDYIGFFDIEPRVVESPVKEVEFVYVGQEELDELVENSGNPDIAQYIVEKFGPVHGIEALAVAKAESGLNCNAVNINTNKTADLSIFQINTVHLNKGGDWTLENIADCYKNIDLAYQLWQDQGFEPWVAWQRGMHLAHLGGK